MPWFNLWNHTVAPRTLLFSTTHSINSTQNTSNISTIAPLLLLLLSLLLFLPLLWLVVLPLSLPLVPLPLLHSFSSIPQPQQRPQSWGRQIGQLENSSSATDSVMYPDGAVVSNVCAAYFYYNTRVLLPLRGGRYSYSSHIDWQHSRLWASYKRRPTATTSI